MRMKRISLLLMALLLLGTVACGNETDSAQESTEIQAETEATTEGTMQEMTTEDVVTEVPTTEVSTMEEVTTEEVIQEASQEPTDEGETTTEVAQTEGELTPDQALALIEKTLGEKDEETGNTYSFVHVNTMTVDGSEYHVFMWGWYVDGNMSHLTDLFVKTDGSAIYEGLFAGDGATVYTETNYLE